MNTRTVTPRSTSIGSTAGRSRATFILTKRKRGADSHQDLRSLMIAAAVALVMAGIVALIWVTVKPLVFGGVGETAPVSTRIEDKRVHSYWKVGSNSFHHYVTDTESGRIVDLGVVTVKDMIAQGIEVPGYSPPAPKGSSDTGSEALAIRFKALQDHLK